MSNQKTAALLAFEAALRGAMVDYAKATNSPVDTWADDGWDADCDEDAKGTGIEVEIRLIEPGRTMTRTLALI